VVAPNNRPTTPLAASRLLPNLTVFLSWTNHCWLCCVSLVGDHSEKGTKWILNHYC